MLVTLEVQRTFTKEKTALTTVYDSNNSDCRYVELVLQLGGGGCAVRESCALLVAGITMSRVLGGQSARQQRRPNTVMWRPAATSLARH